MKPICCRVLTGLIQALPIGCTALLLFALMIETAYAEINSNSNDKILIMKLEGDSGIDAKQLNAISSRISAEIDAATDKKIVTEYDLAKVVNVAEKRQQCGSDDSGFLAEISAAYGIPEIITGHLDRIEPFYVLSLSHINARSGVTIGRSFTEVEGDLGLVLRLVPKSVAKLFGKELPPDHPAASIEAIKSAMKAECRRELEIDGKSYNEDEARTLLNIKDESSPATRYFSDTVEAYFRESMILCMLHKTGKIDSESYIKKRAMIFDRFATLVNINNEMPHQSINNTDLPMYQEGLAGIQAKNDGQPIQIQLGVFSGDRSLNSGNSLNSGQGFRLEVNVPQKSFLYIVLVDSSNMISRIYPAELTGTENPVKGRIRIPTGQSREFYLDDKPGLERLLFFVQPNRSIAIETTLNEVGKTGSGTQEQAVAVLTRGIGIRRKLTMVVNAASSSNSLGKQTLEGLGQAAFEFQIKHR